MINQDLHYAWHSLLCPFLVADCQGETILQVRKLCFADRRADGSHAWAFEGGLSEELNHRGRLQCWVCPSSAPNICRAGQKAAKEADTSWVSFLRQTPSLLMVSE
jgi:hypothetical protein